MRPLVPKLLSRSRNPLLLQLSIELAASLNVRPLFASNELLSVLASFARHPMLYSPKDDFGNAEGTILTGRKIRRVSVQSIFQTHIDRLAKMISELFHLEIYLTIVRRVLSPQSNTHSALKVDLTTQQNKDDATGSIAQP